MVTGLATTYDLTAGVIVEIDPFIRLLSPTETPLQNGRGSNGRLMIGSKPIVEKKFEWQDDSILTPTSVVTGAVTTGGLTLTVASGEQDRFGVGHVLKIGAEQVRITAIAGTDQFTITRGFNSTTAGTLADLAEIKSLGVYLAEGSDPSAARSADWNNRWNMAQVLGPEQIAISETEQRIRKYGLTMTQLDYQAGHRLAEAAISFEQALLYGIRLEDTGAKIRQTGGFKWHLEASGVVDSGTTSPTEATTLAMLETLWGRGASPNVYMTSFANKRIISAWDVGVIRLGRADIGRGQTVEYFDSDAGRVDFHINRWMTDAEAMVYNTDQPEIKTLRPMQFEMLAKTGDSRKAQVVGEKGLKFEAASYGGIFNGFTT